MVLPIGCERKWGPFIDTSGEGGSSTSTGDGGSGGDIFTTTGGSGGGPVCAGACLAGKPAWFEGLSLFWIGPSGDVPPCSDLGLSEGSVGYADPIAPSTCPSCSCSPAACELPESMHVSAAKCPGDGAASIAFDPPAGWEGTCNADGPISGGLQCNGGPCVQSLTISAVNVAPCEPVTGADPGNQPVAWGTVARECVIWPISGEGCATGEACMPVPGAGYAACLYRYGDHTGEQGFACPAEYPRSLVVYSNYEDNRACAPCECSTLDESCQALVSVFKDGACDQVAASVMVSAEQGACVDLLNGTAIGSKSASFILDQPGNCAASGGGPVGGLDLADPVTLCCQPDPGPPH